MDKIAMVKQAEVSGALAALVDEGIVKVASVEDFEGIAQVISENLPEQYDANDFFAKTAEVMDKVYAIYEGASVEEDEGVEKVAEESMDKVAEEDVLATIGIFALQKEAGEITAEEFQEKTAGLAEVLLSAGKNINKVTGAVSKGAGKVKDGAGWISEKAGLKALKEKALSSESGAKAIKKLKDGSEYVKGGFKAKKLRQALKGTQLAKRAPGTMEAPSLAPGVKQLMAAYGTAGAGVAGAGYGGKKLYDRLKG